LNQGKLIAIAIRRHSRAPMVELDRAEITIDRGVDGDFRGKPGPRQVTVLSQDAWHSVGSTLGHELPWTVRRANLFVEGITLTETQGSIIRIGSVVLKVTGETDPCSRMDEQVLGLRQALTPEWRGGVCCQVLSGGLIEPGALVCLENP
jgi:MOSC domain-containing protein YiiM